MKRLVLGILAHVDAGKTTLSEALLYTAGAIPAPSPSGNAAAAPEAVLASASSVQTAVSPSSSLPMKFPNAAV